MRSAYDLDSVKAPQTVGDDGGRRGDGGRREYHHVLEGERRLAQTHELRVAVRRGLHGGDESHLVLRATPDLAPGSLPTQVGVVDPHPSVKLAALRARAHDLHELVLDEPQGLVTSVQVAFKLQRADVVLGLREEVHGQKPVHQRQLGGLEDRAAGHAALVPATGALVIQPAFAPKRAALGATARRADKAIRPARFDQRRVALVIAPIPFHERHHRKSGLKLHRIHRHGSPAVVVNLSSPPTGSPREPVGIRRSSRRFLQISG